MEAESSDSEPDENPNFSGFWTRSETKRMVEVMTFNFGQTEDIDWNFVGWHLEKSPQECKDWFNCIVELHNVMPEGRNRCRRRKNEILRKFLCQEPRCNKSYGTEGALKRHMTKKHMDIPYVPSYRKEKRKETQVKPTTSPYSFLQGPDALALAQMASLFGTSNLALPVLQAGLQFQLQPGQAPPSVMGFQHLNHGALHPTGQAVLHRPGFSGSNNPTANPAMHTTNATTNTSHQESQNTPRAVPGPMRTTPISTIHPAMNFAYNQQVAVPTGMYQTNIPHVPGQHIQDNLLSLDPTLNPYATTSDTDIPVDDNMSRIMRITNSTSTNTNPTPSSNGLYTNNTSTGTNTNTNASLDTNTNTYTNTHAMINTNTAKNTNANTTIAVSTANTSTNINTNSNTSTNIPKSQVQQLLLEMSSIVEKDRVDFEALQKIQQALDMLKQAHSATPTATPTKTTSNVASSNSSHGTPINTNTTEELQIQSIHIPRATRATSPVTLYTSMPSTPSPTPPTPSTPQPRPYTLVALPSSLKPDERDQIELLAAQLQPLQLRQLEDQLIFVQRMQLPLDELILFIKSLMAAQKASPQHNTTTRLSQSNQIPRAGLTPNGQSLPNMRKTFATPELLEAIQGQQTPQLTPSPTLPTMPLLISQTMQISQTLHPTQSSQTSQTQTS